MTDKMKLAIPLEKELGHEFTANGNVVEGEHGSTESDRFDMYRMGKVQQMRVGDGVFQGSVDILVTTDDRGSFGCFQCLVFWMILMATCKLHSSLEPFIVTVPAYREGQIFPWYRPARVTLRQVSLFVEQLGDTC